MYFLHIFLIEHTFSFEAHNTTRPDHDHCRQSLPMDFSTGEKRQKRNKFMKYGGPANYIFETRFPSSLCFTRRELCQVFRKRFTVTQSVFLLTWSFHGWHGGNMLNRTDLEILKDDVQNLIGFSSRTSFHKYVRHTICVVKLQVFR